MLTVAVRFDLSDSEKSLRVEGYAEYFPVIGKPFYFITQHDKAKVYIDLGTVFNIKAYQNLLLVQTDLIVAEVWVKTGQDENWAKVLPFVKPTHIPTQGAKQRGSGSQAYPQRATNSFTSY